MWQYYLTSSQLCKQIVPTRGHWVQYYLTTPQLCTQIVPIWGHPRQQYQITNKCFAQFLCKQPNLGHLSHAHVTTFETNSPPFIGQEYIGIIRS